MKQKIILTAAGLIFIIGAGLLIWHFWPKLHMPKPIVNSAITTPGYYKIIKVIDGDTFDVNMDGHTERVRLIGLDTPETQKPNSPIECFGLAASNQAHKILDNQEVRLESDPINTNRDRYNRLLRYAYLRDGRLYNAEMIKQGYGFAYLSFPFTKSDEFRKYQTEARQNGAGLWSGECQIRDENGRNKTNAL
jgi:micrococcal nuclease